MDRYIDVGKAIEVIVDTPSMVGSKYGFDHDVLTALVDKEREIIDLINNNVPTADVVPVIHAHWIEDGDDYICSNCNEIVFPCVSGLQMDKSLKEGKTYWNYCPHCGAKMEEQ